VSDDPDRRPPAHPPDEHPPRHLPPDPAKYDSPRAELARARGLDAPYIPGGDDPEPETARREERFYGRILVIMVAVIVTAGFVLGILAAILGGR